MSTDMHHHGASAPGELPRNDTVAFETRDIKVRTIYWYLIVLTVCVVGSMVVCIFVLRYAADFVAKSDTPMSPSRAAMGPDYRVMPPEPRLQGVPGHDKDPQQDRRDKTKADDDANESYGWIDQQAGIAKIPVKEAMKIIAEKGLPALTKNVPPAKPSAASGPAVASPPVSKTVENKR
jgi:hypothetical protein